MKDEKRMIRRFVMDIIAVITAFVALYLALWMGLRAYAAPLPGIFLGTFRNEFAGGNPDDVAQMPETGDVITTPKTVVILGSRWKLRPGFMLKSVESTDKKVVGVTMKKWNAVIKAKKAGKADITLTSVDGETETYQIIVEDPQVKSLKITDFVRMNESEYITGTKYLKPTSVGCNKHKIAQVYRDQDGGNIINVFGSGTSKVTVRYGE